MTGGDFVRNVKQVIDLLRQIADVAPDRRDGRDGARRGRRVPAGCGRRFEHRHGARVAMIRPGEEWGSPAESRRRRRGRRGRRRARRCVRRRAPGALIRFIPTRRAISPAPSGSGAGNRSGTRSRSTRSSSETAPWPSTCASLGTPPDRLRRSSRPLELEIQLDGRPWFAGSATTVVIAIGQFLRGLDVVPRGHPGDGRAEIQVYELGRSRAAADACAGLPTGGHVPHPRIRQRDRRRDPPPSPSAAPLRGRRSSPAARHRPHIRVLPGAYRLLV